MTKHRQATLVYVIGSAIAVALVALLTGCQTITWPPVVDNPDLPPVDDPPSATYTFKPGLRVNLAKAITMSANGNSPRLSAANVYHGGNLAEVYDARTGERIYRASEETVSLWEWGGNTWLTPEHGSRVREYTGGSFASRARTIGSWSVTAQGEYVPQNNSYRSAFGARDPFVADVGPFARLPLIRASFQDEPQLIDARDGKYLGTIPAKGMPRAMVFDERGRLYVSLNFGRECLAVQKTVGGTQWDVYDSPALSLAWFNNALIGAGSQKAGPSHLKIGDGKVYRWRGKADWDVLYDTGCYSVPGIVDLGDRLILIGVDPDRAFEMTPDGNGYSFRKVYERSGETARDRSFGGSGCVTDDGTMWIGWSDLGNWSEVFKVRVVR